MQAIILCGGKGERLSPFTNNCPKGMLKIDGKPILEYQILWLKKYGVKKIVFACGYLSEVIKDYFKDGRWLNLEIDYSIEEEPLGRGGAIKKAWEKINNNEPVIVTNGDIYTELDLNIVLRSHREHVLSEEWMFSQSEDRFEQKEEYKEIRKNLGKNILVTICLFPYKSPYGIVRIDSNSLVTSFDEKRTLPYWVNGGIYIFEKEVWNYLPEKGDHEVTTFIELAKKGLMHGYKCYDYWRGIDTVKDLNEFAGDKRYLTVTG